METVLFTLEKANATLPLVRLVVREIIELTGEIKQTRRRLAVAGEKVVPGLEQYFEEVQAIRQATEENEARVEQCVAELKALGVETDHAAQGQIEFPARTDNDLIYLGWQFDDPEILYWRPAVANSQRKPIESLIASKPNRLFDQEPQLGFDEADAERWSLPEFGTGSSKPADNN